MSLAKQLIGEPAPKAESKPAAQESKPIHAMDLIDTLAAQEFSPTMEAGVKHDRTGVGSPSDGSAPSQSSMRKGKQQKGKVATGKKTPGQVASTPTAADPVKYGKK